MGDVSGELANLIKLLRNVKMHSVQRNLIWPVKELASLTSLLQQMKAVDRERNYEALILVMSNVYQRSMEIIIDMCRFDEQNPSWESDKLKTGEEVPVLQEGEREKERTSRRRNSKSKKNMPAERSDLKEETGVAASQHQSTSKDKASKLLGEPVAAVSLECQGEARKRSSSVSELQVGKNEKLPDMRARRSNSITERPDILDEEGQPKKEQIRGRQKAEESSSDQERGRESEEKEREGEKTKRSGNFMSGRKSKSSKSPSPRATDEIMKSPRTRDALRKSTTSK